MARLRHFLIPYQAIGILRKNVLDVLGVVHLANLIALADNNQDGTGYSIYVRCFHPLHLLIKCLAYVHRIGARKGLGALKEAAMSLV